MARPAFDRYGDPGRLCRLEPCRADRRRLGVRRRLLLAGATASLAVAIWTMHFVGMLAVRLPFQVDYLVLPTLLSFLICAIVVGAAVYATSSGPLTLLRLTLSACLMGGGIFTMHYIGMNALDASAYMIHNRFYVAASMAIAIARLRTGALACHRTGRAAAADPVRHGLRHRRLGDALHRDGGRDALSVRHERLRGACAVHRPPRHRRRGRRILRLGNIPLVAPAGRYPFGIAVPCR